MRWPRVPKLSDGEVVSLFKEALRILDECEAKARERRIARLENPAIEAQATKREEDENK